MFAYAREVLRQTIWDAAHHFAIFPKECSDRILVVQEEGLGNAILTTPLIQALKTLQPVPKIDVLVNRNKGADLIFGRWDLICKIWDRDEFASLGTYIHYRTVLECHPRHELPRNIKYQYRHRIDIRIQPGLDYHWHFKKHESEYLLDLARQLGYKDSSPSLRQLIGDSDYIFNFSDNMIAIGIGYYKGLRADGRDWSNRHWGNENYLNLCSKLKLLGFRPVLVGDQKDFDRDGKWLLQQGVESICGRLSLAQVINFIGRCQAFIGNDTGLMHLAAAVTIPTIGIFINTSSIKSYPLGDCCQALGGNQGEKEYEIQQADILNVLSSLLESCESEKITLKDKRQ